MSEWQVVTSEVVYEGRFTVIKDQLRWPDGTIRDYTWIDSPAGVVAVLPFDADGRVVLTKQYRHPLKRIILDLPAGGLYPGEAPADGAARELREETGYVAQSLTRLGGFYPSPGIRSVAV